LVWSSSLSAHKPGGEVSAKFSSYVHPSTNKNTPHVGSNQKFRYTYLQDSSLQLLFRKNPHMDWKNTRGRTFGASFFPVIASEICIMYKTFLSVERKTNQNGLKD
jgi:hypothetical protein